MSEQTTVPAITATVTHVSVSATLAEPGPPTVTCTGEEIIPERVEWSAHLYDDGHVIRTTTVIAANSNNKTWHSYEVLPSWVPQPPAGWDAALGVTR